jgi:hypothetical protein
VDPSSPIENQTFSKNDGRSRLAKSLDLPQQSNKMGFWNIDTCTPGACFTKQLTITAKILVDYKFFKN